MRQDPLSTEIGRHIWATKYRDRRGGEVTVDQTWRRVARALAAVETHDRAGWERRFYRLLEGFAFLPGGRIQAGAGSGRRVTLFNCFVMGWIEDSLDGIFEALKEGAVTMQQGGGVGYDFSTLRPAGTPAHTTGTIASGPVSFLRVWDSMCATVLSTGARRGAMMATLRADHPDVERFLEAKRQPGALTHFNLSLQVSDELLEAVRLDRDWPLVFPDAELAFGEGAGSQGTVERWWPGREGIVPCRVIRTVRARELWHRLMRRTYEGSEPGVLFIDRINRLNNLAYRERITATNPCGEVPLPPYGACDLGSFNLTRFVIDPFTAEARLDLSALAEAVPVAVRLLDNVIDVSQFPLRAQLQQARGSRRIGLGLSGLADTFILLGLRYGSPEASRLAAEVMRTICRAAYRASAELAAEKGSFPFFDRDALLAGEFVGRLPEEIRRGIATSGLRNSHLTAIAPTGTISLLAGNISSGLEPVYRATYARRLLELDGSTREIELTDHAIRLWWELRGSAAPPPPAFVTAAELTPEAHLEIQAALQPWVDQAISKTVQVPEDYPFEAFAELYRQAWEKGLKGCTTFRPSALRGEVLHPVEAGPGAEPHCCTLEREGD